MLDTFTCAMVRASLRSGRCPVSPEQLSNGVGIRMIEFRERFSTEDACAAYLAELRWPDSFVIPSRAILGDPRRSPGIGVTTIYGVWLSQVHTPDA